MTNSCVTVVFIRCYKGFYLFPALSILAFGRSVHFASLHCCHVMRVVVQNNQWFIRWNTGFSFRPSQPLFFVDKYLFPVCFRFTAFWWRSNRANLLYFCFPHSESHNSKNLQSTFILCPVFLWMHYKMGRSESVWDYEWSIYDRN